MELSNKNWLIDTFNDEGNNLFQAVILPPTISAKFILHPAILAIVYFDTMPISAPIL